MHIEVQATARPRIRSIPALPYNVFIRSGAASAIGTCATGMRPGLNSGDLIWDSARRGTRGSKDDLGRLDPARTHGPADRYR